MNVAVAGVLLLLLIKLLPFVLRYLLVTAGMVAAMFKSTTCITDRPTVKQQKKGAQSKHYLDVFAGTHHVEFKVN